MKIALIPNRDKPDAIAEFKKGFETASGELLVKDEPVEALEDEDVKQEKITRRVKK